MMINRLRDNITTEDIECNCGCGFKNISPATLDVVQDAREHFNKPVHINSRNHSACRCDVHNASEEVGGSKYSKHLPDELNEMSRAVDFEIEGVPHREVYDYLDIKYPSCLGLGLYNWGLHVDDRMKRAYRWGNI